MILTYTVFEIGYVRAGRSHGQKIHVSPIEIGVFNFDWQVVKQINIYLKG